MIKFILYLYFGDRNGSLLIPPGPRARSRVVNRTRSLHPRGSLSNPLILQEVTSQGHVAS